LTPAGNAFPRHHVLYREAYTLLEELTDATLDGTRKAYLADLAAVGSCSATPRR
jgi:hypothetical protein